MSVFFDTNILVYAVDRSQQAKQAIAMDLVDRHVREHRLVISTQLLQEF